MMNTSAFLGSQRKEESHGFHPCHGGEGIVEVDAFRCTKLRATKRALCLTMAPASSLFSLNTHLRVIAL
jgi:hypothetical protein